MGYIDYNYVDDRMSDLAGLIPEGKTAATWVGLLIDDAQAEVDAALRTRYAVPVASSAPGYALVQSLTYQLTQYRLLLENYRQEEGEINEWVEEIGRKARQALKDIANGLLDVDTADSEASIQSSTMGVAREFTSTTRDSQGNILTEGTMEVW